MNVIFRLVTVTAIVASTVAHAAAPATAKQEFTRFVTARDGSARLQTAIVRYTQPDTGQVVDLVGAVHIGDAKYYRELNDRFKKYDAVLYELVKPRDVDVPAPGERREPGSMLGTMYQMMGSMLDLSFQLEEVDYTAKNFVHADMDADTFFARMDERGESFLSLYVRMVLHEMSRPQQGAMANPDVQLGQFLAALTAPDRPRQLKLMLGGQLKDIDARMEVMEGTVLLTERNDAAMKVLKDTLANGGKSVAVFYGAAHLKGMEQTLVDEMGFKRGETTWMTAWDIGPDTAPEPAIAPATQPVK
jgi:hypothetical protein